MARIAAKKSIKDFTKEERLDFVRTNPNFNFWVNDAHNHGKSFFFVLVLSSPDDSIFFSGYPIEEETVKQAEERLCNVLDTEGYHDFMLVTVDTEIEFAKRQ